MSLNQISQANPAIQPLGLIDAQFRSLKASNLEIQDVTVDNLECDALTTNTLAVLGSVTAPLQVDGSVTAQAVLADQLAVAGTLYPLAQATSRNLVIESNDIQDLEYTKYNLLGVNNPTSVSVASSVPTEVVGPFATDFNGSYAIQFLKDVQTYKFTAQCRYITPNAGTLRFAPKIGTVVLTSIQTPMIVSNTPQQMEFQIIFSVLSGAGTATTQISHSSSMVWNNDTSVNLNRIGTNGTGPISTINAGGTVPSIELTYNTTGLDIDIDSYSLTRIY